MVKVTETEDTIFVNIDESLDVEAEDSLLTDDEIHDILGDFDVPTSHTD